MGLSIFAECVEAIPNSFDDKFNPDRAAARIRSWLRGPIKSRGMKLESVYVSESGYGQILVSAPFDMFGIPAENRTGDDALLAYVEGDAEAVQAFDANVWTSMRGILDNEDREYTGWSVGGEAYDAETHRMRWSGRLQLSFDFKV